MNDRIDLTKDNEEIEKEFKQREGEIYTEENDERNIASIVENEEKIEIKEEKDKNFYSQVEIEETKKSKLQIILPLILILIIFSFGIYYYLSNTPKNLFIKTFEKEYNLYNKKIDEYAKIFNNNFKGKLYEFKLTQNLETNNPNLRKDAEVINNVSADGFVSFENKYGSLNIVSPLEENLNILLSENKLQINDNYIELKEYKLKKKKINLKELKTASFTKEKTEEVINGNNYEVKILSLILDEKEAKKFDIPNKIDMYLSEDNVIKYVFKQDGKDITIINLDNYFDFTIKEDERLKISFIKEDDTLFLNFEEGMITFTKESEKEYSFILKKGTLYYNGKISYSSLELNEKEKVINANLSLDVNNATKYSADAKIIESRKEQNVKINGVLVSKNFKNFINKSINKDFLKTKEVYKKQAS